MATAAQSLTQALDFQDVPDFGGIVESTSFDPLLTNALSGLQNLTSSTISQAAVDFRIRLSAQTNATTQVYGDPSDPDNILAILHDTNGMLFPYTPVINWSQNVDYRALEMVHTNQDFYVYARTPSLEISLAGDFTIQNYREGQYALACVHFLRTVSKMYFGETTATNPTQSSAGTPPPVLLLNGYGNYMFNNLRVILRSHSYTFDKNVDYVNVAAPRGMARLPALFNISMQLIVQNTPNRLRTEFNLDDFRTGRLMRDGKDGWI